MLKILTKPFCSISARLLRDELQALLNKRVLVTREPSKIKGPFIRYGHAGLVKGGDTAYNSAPFISLVANKAPFSKLMEKNKIYSPIYYSNEKPKNFPVLIRKTLTGAGGSGIVLCKDEKTFNENWNNQYVWTPFVKTQFELRVHVLGGKIVKVFKKLYAPENPEQEVKEPEFPIRNNQRGYHFSLKEAEKYPKLQEVVNKVHPILKGSFYTLDIGWDATKKEYFIFEANSGSGLNQETAKLYAKYLVDEMKGNKNE